METPAAKLWIQAQALLKDMLGRRAYKLWFAEVRPLRVRGKSITVEVPTDFHAAYIREHYLETAETALFLEHAREMKIRLEVSKAQDRMPPQLTYFHQRMAAMRDAARKHNVRLAADAKRFLADAFHKSVLDLNMAFLWLSGFSSSAKRPLTLQAVRTHLSGMLDAVRRPAVPLWLPPK